MRTVLTRDRLRQLLRRRWLLAAVVLVMVLAAIVVTQRPRLALAADTRGGTQLVSLDVNGGQSRGFSSEPTISGDGRFVAFSSFAALDPLDASNDGSLSTELDVYARDTVANTTTYLSSGRQGAVISAQPGAIRPNADGIVASNGPSSAPSISSDGRYVAFVSDAPNVTSVPVGHFKVVICDRGAPNASGAFTQPCTYTLISTPGAPDDDESKPSLSRVDGSTLRLGYLSRIKDATALTLSLASDGSIVVPADSAYKFPKPPATLTADDVTMSHAFDFGLALSANGRWLVTTSEYSTGEGSQLDAVLVSDLNAPDSTAVRMDFATLGNSPTFVGDGDEVLNPAVSGDGRRVAFTQLRSADELPVLHLVNRDANFRTVNAGVESLDVNGNTVTGDHSAFSADGRYLAFVTDAGNVHNGLDDTNQASSCQHFPIEGIRGRPAAVRPAATGVISHCDVVVRDLVQDEQRAAAKQPRLPAELASPSQDQVLPGTSPQVTCPTVCEGDGESDHPVLDADGSAVAFESSADDLLPRLATGAPGDANSNNDVFKRTFKPAPALATLDFGSVLVQTPVSGSVTVSYTGFGPLRITGFTIGGTNPGDFTVTAGSTCVGAVLHPGDTCSVPIQFKPAALNARTATLTATTDTGVRATGTLTGTGAAEPPPRTPVFQAAPDPLAFGPQQPFLASAPKTVTVTNAGTGPLNVTAVALTGSFPGDYAISANTCVGTPVDPGRTCTVSVTFAPQATTDRPAVLQFTDNAIGSPHLVALTGSGTPPKLVASPPLARSGAISQITGTGWPPNKVVVITLLTTPIQVRATASDTGTFTVPLVIFPHTPLGKKQLQGQVQVVPQITATIDFLVVPGSLLPPDFGERR